MLKSSLYTPGDDHKCEISKDGVYQKTVQLFPPIYDMQTLFRIDFS